MTKSSYRLRPKNSVLVLIDVQDKLLARIPSAGGLLRNTGFLLDVAGLFGVPIQATEQYPQGLGPTTEELASRLADGPIAKTSFSCCGTATFLPELTHLQRHDVVLIGMETHICVAQTTLDLLAAGLHVYLPVDAIASRFNLDHNTALRRLERAGATLTTVEAVAFEWAADAAHPKFKELSKMVIERAEAVAAH